MLAICLGAGTGTEIIVNSNQVAYDLFTAAGSPSGKQNIVCIIQPGVVFTSSGITTPAFKTGGGWGHGTTIKIINKGSMYGLKGSGGVGGSVGSHNGGNGQNGGWALELEWDVTLDNTLGIIFGAGGGGGGGGFGSGDGGSGGHGQDNTAAASSGNAGTGTGGNGKPGGDYATAGTNGQAGTIGAGGTKGAAGAAIVLNGNSITWLGGNNSSQVKGTVS